jgi:predicted nucleic-acid-binding Zn-ribbon protein
MMDEFTEVVCKRCSWSGFVGELDDSAYEPKIFDRCPDCGSDNVEDEDGNRARYEP